MPPLLPPVMVMAARFLIGLPGTRCNCGTTFNGGRCGCFLATEVWRWSRIRQFSRCGQPIRSDKREIFPAAGSRMSVTNGFCVSIKPENGFHRIINRTEIFTGCYQAWCLITIKDQLMRSARQPPNVGNYQLVHSSHLKPYFDSFDKRSL